MVVVCGAIIFSVDSPRPTPSSNGAQGVEENDSGGWEDVLTTLVVGTERSFRSQGGMWWDRGSGQGDVGV